MNLYFDKKNKQYVTVDSQKCGVCRGMIQPFQKFLFQTKYYTADKRKPVTEHIYCLACLEIHRFSGDMENNILITVVEDVMPEDIPVFWTAPRLSTRKNETVFTAAETQLDQEEIVDKTKHAGRNSWEGMMVGVDPGPDKLIDFGSLDDHIKGLTHSQKSGRELEYRKEFKEEGNKK